MNNIISKYSAPFTNKEVKTFANILSKTIPAGTGSLKIGIPVLSIIDDCVGFVVKVESKSGTSLFDGTISGNSTKGYDWVKVSAFNNDKFSVSSKPLVFKSEEIVDGSKKKWIKYILIGDNSTYWGDFITVKIDCLNYAIDNTKETTASTYFRTANPSMYLYSGNWNLSVGQYSTDSSSAIVPSITGNISLSGVITGTSEIDSSGNSTIETKFRNNEINLGTGKIIADGSKLFNLGDAYLGNSNNSSQIKNYTPSSSEKLSKKVVVESLESSDVYLTFEFDGSVYKIDIDPVVRRIDHGVWEEGTGYLNIIPKSTSDVNVASTLNLLPGELAVYKTDSTSDLLLGVGVNSESSIENQLLGGLKNIVNDTIPEEYNLKGKMVLHQGIPKWYDGNEWRNILNTTAEVGLSLDSLQDKGLTLGLVNRLALYYNEDDPNFKDDGTGSGYWDVKRLSTVGYEYKPEEEKKDLLYGSEILAHIYDKELHSGGGGFTITVRDTPPSDDWLNSSPNGAMYIYAK
jgi:hypothetical protein